MWPRSPPRPALAHGPESTAATNSFISRLDSEGTKLHEEWAALLPVPPPSAEKESNEMAMANARASLQFISDSDFLREREAARAEEVKVSGPIGESAAAPSASAKNAAVADVMPANVEEALLQQPPEKVAAAHAEEAFETLLRGALTTPQLERAAPQSAAVVRELNRIARLDAASLWEEWSLWESDDAANFSSSIDSSCSAFASWIARVCGDSEETGAWSDVADVLGAVAKMFDVSQEGQVRRDEIEDGTAFLAQWLRDNGLFDAEEEESSEFGIAAGSDACVMVEMMDEADPITSFQSLVNDDSVTTKVEVGGGRTLTRDENLLTTRDLRYSLWHPKSIACNAVREKFGELASQLLRSEAASFEALGGRVVVAPEEPTAPIAIASEGDVEMVGKETAAVDGEEIEVDAEAEAKAKAKAERATEAEVAARTPRPDWGIGLRRNDVIYPICADGLFESQVLAHVIRTLHYSEAPTGRPVPTVMPPHGALRGFDPYWRTTSLGSSVKSGDATSASESESQKEKAVSSSSQALAPDFVHAPVVGEDWMLRAECFARATDGEASLQPRAGESHCNENKCVMNANLAEPMRWGRIDSSLASMRAYFSARYYGSVAAGTTDATTSIASDVATEATMGATGKRRVFICLGVSAMAVVLRRVLEVADGNRCDGVIICCLPWSDRIATAGSKAQITFLDGAVAFETLVESSVRRAIAALRSVVLPEETRGVIFVRDPDIYLV